MSRMRRILSPNTVPVARVPGSAAPRPALPAAGAEARPTGQRRNAHSQALCDAERTGARHAGSHRQPRDLSSGLFRRDPDFISALQVEPELRIGAEPVPPGGVESNPLLQLLGALVQQRVEQAVARRFSNATPSGRSNREHSSLASVTTFRQHNGRKFIAAYCMAKAVAFPSSSRGTEIEAP